MGRREANERRGGRKGKGEGTACGREDRHEGPERRDGQPDPFLPTTDSSESDFSNATEEKAETYAFFLLCERAQLSLWGCGRAWLDQGAGEKGPRGWLQRTNDKQQKRSRPCIPRPLLKSLLALLC